MPLGIYFVKTFRKKYGCEFISSKDELWILILENAEVRYHLGFFLLKLLIKGAAVSLVKTKERR